jgi:predicted MPP superfamily phosphohydrolase
MSLFLAGFFLIYSLLHLHLFLKAKAAFSLGSGVSILLAFFMIVMITAPVVTRLSENAGFLAFARFMAYAGYTWMALLFLFFCLSLVADACRLAFRGMAMATGRTNPWLVFPAKWYFLLPATAALAVGFYGWFEARDIRTGYVSIVTPKVPGSMSPLRIVQVSDVHIGLTLGKERLARIIDRVRQARPDLLVSTGDLVDGQMDDVDGLADMFHTITPRYGKFAVTGNHEFYAGLGQALAFTRAAGFRVLRQEAVTIGEAVTIAGVADPAGPGYGASSADEHKLLSPLPPGRFTIFLKHRPSVARESVPFFDLQLSGHVHDGQIFPFRLITRLFYPLVAGYYRLSGTAALYVSRGSGTWGPPIRVLSPPEVTVIDIVGGESGKLRRPPGTVNLHHPGGSASVGTMTRCSFSVARMTEMAT